MVLASISIYQQNCVEYNDMILKNGIPITIQTPKSNLITKKWESKKWWRWGWNSGMIKHIKDGKIKKYKLRNGKSVLLKLWWVKNLNFSLLPFPIHWTGNYCFQHPPVIFFYSCTSFQMDNNRASTANQENSRKK